MYKPVGYHNARRGPRDNNNNNNNNDDDNNDNITNSNTLRLPARRG